MLANLFYNPIQLRFYSQIWLALPVCVAVAVVYKTVRTQNLRRLPLECVHAFLGIMTFLATVAIVLWLVQQYWP